MVGAKRAARFTSRMSNERSAVERGRIQFAAYGLKLSIGSFRSDSFQCISNRLISNRWNTADRADITLTDHIRDPNVIRNLHELHFTERK